MGKVHGSLARAGKVKGQTPKVEKQKKKKKQEVVLFRDLNIGEDSIKSSLLMKKKKGLIRRTKFKFNFHL